MISTLLVNSVCHTSEQIQGPFMNIVECKMKKKSKQLVYHHLQIKHLHFFFLNTRSFPKHAIDISKDKRLYQADILCLTETHITPEQTTNRSGDKFQSLSVEYRDTVRIDFYDAMQGRSYVYLSKINFMNFSFRVLLLYRKNSENLKKILPKF